MNKAQLREKQEAAKRVRTKGYARRVQILYNDAIDAVSLVAADVQFLPGIFDLNRYPSLKQKITSILRELASKQETLLVKGINYEWNTSQSDKPPLAAEAGAAEGEPCHAVLQASRLNRSACLVHVIADEQATQSVAARAGLFFIAAWLREYVHAGAPWIVGSDDFGRNAGP